MKGQTDEVNEIYKILQNIIGIKFKIGLHCTVSSEYSDISYKEIGKASPHVIYDLFITFSAVIVYSFYIFLI